MQQSMTFDSVDLADYGLTVLHRSDALARETAGIQLIDYAYGGTSSKPAVEMILDVAVQATDAATLLAYLDGIRRTLDKRGACQLSIDAVPGRYWRAQFRSMLKGVAVSNVWKGQLVFTLHDPAAFADVDTANKHRIGVIKDGLVLYAPLWHPDLSVSPFTTIDSISHTATVSGAVWSTDGYTFDGISNFIDLGNDASINFGTGDFTYSFWVKPATDTGTRYIVSKGAYSTVAPGFTARQVSTSSMHIMVADGTERVIYTLTGITSGSSYNIAAVVDRAGQVMSIYRGGALVDTISIASVTGSVDIADNLYLGRNSGANADHYSGTIGDFQVYNRAFTPQEIEQIYNATRWRYR